MTEPQDPPNSAIACEACAFQESGRVETDASSKSSFFQFFVFLFRRNGTRLALGGVFCFLVSLGLRGLGAAGVYVTSFQVAGLLIAGFPLARSGVASLVKDRRFTIELLMAVAACGAIWIGDMEEGISLVFLFVLAMALEDYTSEHAGRALIGLSSLAPAKAIRWDGKNEETVPVEQLKFGDRLLVKPGERIPMDGTLITGAGEVNQAPITGESIPVLKDKGGTLYAGSINGSGVIEMQVTGNAADNTIARIIHMITASQQARTPRQRLIERFAAFYTPAIFAVALLVMWIPPLVFGQPFFDLPDGTHGWVYRALSLMVIGCPCALVLSTPVATLSGIIRAARQGILVKGGRYLEGLSSVRTFAFDKTGTLTRGEPHVVFSRSVDCNCREDCEHQDDILAIAGSLERGSTHPIAQAVVNEVRERGLMDQYPPAQDVVVSAGQGITGKVNGRPVLIGSHRQFDQSIRHSPEVCYEVSKAESDGYSAMLLYDQAHVSGFIAVADQPRPESAAVVSALHAMGKKTVMLTGDNDNTARSVGEAIGVDEIHAALLPADKVQMVNRLKEFSGPVAMLGDGINDAPALAAADIGIAVGGSASAQTLETADVVLMAAGLNQLPFSIRLSAYTKKIIRQNLDCSLGIKILFLALALLGLAPLWLAVLADSGMAALVVLNSLRPLRFKSVLPVA